MNKTRGPLCLLVALAVVFGLCACTVTIEPTDETQKIQNLDVDTKATEPTTESTEPTTESTDPTTEATDPTESTEPAEVDSTLISVRQAMVGTPELFAMKYLGYVDETMEGDTQQILEQLCPDLLTDLPFVAQIPDEHVIGGAIGELYLFIPRDPASSVSVGLLPEEATEDMTQVLYQAVSGDPLLIYANGGGFEPNIEVSIVAEDGIAVKWYPYLDEYGLVDCPMAGDVALAFDMTNYSDDGSYGNWLSNGWIMPEEELLYSTAWTYMDTASGENNVLYTMDLLEDGSARLYSYLEGEDELLEEYEGEWNTHVEGEMRCLNLNLERAGGMLYQDGEEPVILVDSFPLLVHFSEAYLMLGKGLDQAPLPFLTDGEITAVFEAAVG